MEDLDRRQGLLLPPAFLVSRSVAPDVHGLSWFSEFFPTQRSAKPSLMGTADRRLVQLGSPALSGPSSDPHSAICPGEWTGDGGV